MKGAYITQDEKGMIEAVVDSGNAAAHRGHRPSLEDLLTLESVVVRLLHKIYIKPDEDLRLLDDSQKVKSRVPPRASKAGK